MDTAFFFLLQLIAVFLNLLVILIKKMINLEEEKRLAILRKGKRYYISCLLKALLKPHKSILDKEMLRLHMDPSLLTKNIIILCPTTPIYYIDAGEAMRFERLRLSSFVDPRARRFYQQGLFFIPLAQNGFYYNATRDEVLCYTCDCNHMQGHAQNCNWRVGNEPFHQVRELQPTDPGGDGDGDGVIRRRRRAQESSEHRCLPGSSLNEDSEHAEETVSHSPIQSSQSATGFGRSDVLVQDIMQRPVQESSERREVRRQDLLGSSLHEHCQHAEETVSHSPIQSFQSATGFGRSDVLVRDIMQMPVQESSERREVRRQDLLGSSLHEHCQHAEETVSHSPIQSFQSATGEQVLGGAVYPEFSTVQSRLASLQRSGVTTPSSDMIATSGFFYAGQPDYVCCFYCGVGLSSWDNHSALLAEHLRRSPNCEFQQITRGRQHSDGGPISSSQATDDQDALSQSRDPRQDNPDHPGHHRERQGRAAVGQLVNAGIQSKKLGKPGGTQRGGDSSGRPLCHKCKDKPVDTMFLPCRHTTSCQQCARQMKQCDRCKDKICEKRQVIL